MADFFLRTTKKAGNATIYFRVQRRKPSLNIMVSTQMEADIKEWNKAKASKKGLREKFCESKEGKELFDKLDEIRGAVNDLIDMGEYAKDGIDNTVSSVVYKEIRQEQRLQREEDERNKALIVAERKRNVINYLDNLVNGIDSGERKHDGKEYDKNTAKVWHTFQKLLKGFYKKNPFTWDEIDKPLADKFTLYLESKGFMPSTIRKHITLMRALISFSATDKMHDNKDAVKLFDKRKIHDEEKAKEIYLTADEIQALYEMPLLGLQSIIRDVFLVGTYTCQRFSDYSNLKSTNFTKTSRGTDVVIVRQEKTGNTAVVPVLNDNLLTIAKKYDYEIPKVSDVVLNREIKKILKDLSEKVPSLAKTEITRLTLKEISKERQKKVKWMRDKYGNVIKPRYDLVSSHTARRSGITNLYLSGKFDFFQMMSISGHKDQRTFLEYIKLSSMELADKISQKSKEFDEKNAINLNTI